MLPDASSMTSRQGEQWGQRNSGQTRHLGQGRILPEPSWFLCLNPESIQDGDPRGKVQLQGDNDLLVLLGTGSAQWGRAGREREECDIQYFLLCFAVKLKPLQTMKFI